MSGKENSLLFRALFYVVVLFGLAWGAFRVYDTGEIPLLGQQLEDAKTLAAVKTALSLHGSLAARPISIRARDGVVTLTGEVGSEAERAEAEALVASVEGVDSVENLIAITPALGETSSGSGLSLGQRLDDTALAAKIKAAFALHRDLNDLNIKVDTHQGAVVLEGRVETAEQSKMARRWAERVEGVKSVENRLRLPGDAGPESVFAVRIQEVLSRNPHLGKYDLRVRERADETLMLEGEVSTGAERQLAELLAREAAEGEQIQNDIRVKNP